MKKCKFVSIFLLVSLLLSLLCAGGAWALEDPEVSAPNIVLAELESGEVFFTRDETARIYPASLTKIMTVLLAVEAIERGETALTDPVMASANITYDLESDGSTAGITAGEVLTLENLLQCALVASANEACNIIAEHISGSTEAFIQLMNQRAQELGCTGTHFANTHGLPNEDHYTTAWDMYLISREAVSHEIIANICAMTEITIPATDVSASRTFKNTNALLGDNDYYKGYFYEGASGVKTGHTNAAGYCLIATAERDGLRLLSVVMGAQATEREDGSLDVGSFADTTALFDWAFDNYSYQDILRSTEVVSDLPIAMGSSDVVSVRPQTSIKALLPNDIDMSVFQRELTIFSEEEGQELTAPISAGDVLGEIAVSRNGQVYGRTALVATKSVELSRLEYIKSEVKAFFGLTVVKVIIAVIILLLLLYIVLVVRYRILRARHLRSVRAAKQERARRAAQAEIARARAAVPPQPDFSDDADPEAPENPEAWGDAPNEDTPETAAQVDRDYFEEFFRK